MVTAKRKNILREKPSRASKSPIKDSQLILPAGYHIDGKKVANLHEVLDPYVPTMALAELLEEQRVALVTSRLELQPDNYRIAMIGPGIINKARAIAEVRAGSRIGRLIMEIEQYHLLRLYSQSEKKHK
jgi:hypothetical protein